MNENVEITNLRNMAERRSPEFVRMINDLARKIVIHILYLIYIVEIWRIAHVLEKRRVDCRGWEQVASVSDQLTGQSLVT